MNTSEYAAVAAAHSVDPDRWQAEFSAVLDRIAPRFARYEPLRHAGELMAGMVPGLDRKNCWTIAEYRGAITPDGLQHLLARASWDADDGVAVAQRGWASADEVINTWPLDRLRALLAKGLRLADDSSTAHHRAGSLPIEQAAEVGQTGSPRSRQPPRLGRDRPMRDRSAATNDHRGWAFGLYRATATPSKDQPHAHEDCDHVVRQRQRKQATRSPRPLGSGQRRNHNGARERTVKPRADSDQHRDPGRNGQRSLGVAEGVLVALRHCSPDEAFIDIVETAKRHTVAPFELADALVAIAVNDVSRDFDDAVIAAVDQAWGVLFGQLAQLRG